MAKRGHPPKTKRNEELVKMRDQMDLSFERLGKIYGISKQAAHKIYHTYAVRSCSQREALLKEEPISNTRGTASLIPQWLVDWENEQNY